MSGEWEGLALERRFSPGAEFVIWEAARLSNMAVPLAMRASSSTCAGDGRMWRRCLTAHNARLRRSVLEDDAVDLMRLLDDHLYLVGKE